MAPVGRPGWILIPALVGGKLRSLPRSYIHHEDVVIAGLESFCPSKCNMRTIGIPRRVGRFPCACADSLDVGPFQSHLVNLWHSPTSRDIHKVGSRLGIDLRFHLDSSRCRNPMKVTAVRVGHI